MDYPRAACVHELVEAQVARTPQAVAVSRAGETLTYAALDGQANQLAHVLQTLGVGPEVLVGICLDRSVAMVVAVLGVLKAGGAYVPLDPGYPAARLALMLEDGRPRVVVTQEKYRSLVSEHGATVLCLDTDGAVLAGARRDKPAAAVGGANRAYVIFTSGSTGRPKGVQITHQAVVNFLLSMAHEPGLAAEDTLLAVTTLSFDIAGLELYLPLIVGGRVELASREMAVDGERLMAALDGVSVMQATPATWRLLLEAGWPGNAGLKVLCGGEALPADLLGELLTRSSTVWNLYGPTETTIWSTTGELLSASDPVTIGRPIANTQAYVLDARGQPVPVGVPGELYLGGEGLSWGYLGQPGMTAAKFVPNPFSPVPGARLYHTGDVARYRPDGRLEYLGRVDQQVKVRGFRIELGEIETALAQAAGVRQAVVVAQAEPTGSQRLVAYLVVEPGADTGAATLRAFLKTRLPEYMIPAIFVTLDRLPLTPNGKVDRRSLPAPDAVDAAPDPDAVGPRSPLEAQLLDLWQNILGRPVHGVHDNFFALGGHSLMATQVMARVRSQFDVKISLRTLFEAPTVAGLAEAIVEQELAQADPLLLAELLGNL
jgi:amino acid adenylation domain-containing protein